MRIALVGTLALVAQGIAPACAADSITVLPAEIALRGVEARQQLLVERSRDDQFVGQVAAETQFTSSNPQVVAIESGVLKPLANGEATITATAAGATPRHTSS